MTFSVLHAMLLLPLDQMAFIHVFGLAVVVLFCLLSFWCIKTRCYIAYIDLLVHCKHYTCYVASYFRIITCFM